MIQKTLFPDTPAKLSRRSDPITSQQSAADTEAKLGALQSLMLSVIRHSVDPVTSNEAAKECSDEFSGRTESFRKRTGELLRMDLIEQAGERRCNITGKNAMTFRVRLQR